MSKYIDMKDLTNDRTVSFKKDGDKLELLGDLPHCTMIKMDEQNLKLLKEWIEVQLLPFEGKKNFLFQWESPSYERNYQVFENVNRFGVTVSYDVELRERNERDGFWETDEENSEYEIDANCANNALFHFLSKYGSWEEVSSFQKKIGLPVITTAK